MKLKRVELQGFKSFADRTVLPFESGVTAILGPNGCGKTNIVDAIRWVLGEQSAKQLRGTVMEDIIFKGAVNRKATGFAEVGLTFTNEDRGLPIEYDEVSIKRRVQRDGISQYFLNGAPCRLKDLRDLFYDSGVNNTAYSVIEQSMINQVLNENTQELRNLIEEGSGIVKYKARRRETQRKLEQTEQDLLRLRDLLEEIGREVRALQRQVGKARRHQRLFREIRTLDLLLAERAARGYDQREAELKARRGELALLAEADAGELATLRARVESTRPAVDEREAERQGLEESLRAFEEELQESERRALLLEHRIAEHQRRAGEAEEDLAGAGRRREEIGAETALLVGRLAALADELALLDAGLRAQEQELQQLEVRYTDERQALARASQLNLEFIESDATQKSLLRELQVKQENRRDRLRTLDEEAQAVGAAGGEATSRQAELEETAQRLRAKRRELLETMAGLERDLDETGDRVGEQRRQLAGLEARREALRSRHDVLRRIKDEYRGYGQAARKLLQEHAADGAVLGSLADRLQVEPSWAEAFENLLAELSEAVLVDRAPTALRLVGELRSRGGGRAGFLCRDAGRAGAPPPAAPPAGRPAAELVRGEGMATAHLSRLLAATWVFENDAAALAAAEAHDGPVPLICLARSGLVVSSDGIVRGGQGRGEEASLLGRGERLEKLEAELTELERDIEAWGLRADQTAARQRELQEYLTRGRAELAILDADLGQVHVEAAAEQSRADAAADRQAAIAGERGRLEAELAGLAAEEEALRDRLSASGRDRSDSTVRLDELRARVRDVETRRDELRGAVEAGRLERSRREGERRQAEGSRAHLRGGEAELDAREESLRQELALCRSELAELTAELVERRQRLADGALERERRRQLVQAAGEAIRALHAETDAWHDRIKAIEEQRGRCRDELHAAETELATLDIRRRNLQERIEETYKGSFRELVRAIDLATAPRELVIEEEVFQVDQAAALLAERREALAALGPVNHLAIEEYEAKKDRLRFLEGQLKDVEQARQDLETAIQQINRTARRLFADTFEEVRRNYIAVFQTLFEGGRADLEQIRTDDPLESHIRIQAQPGGKLIDHVGLLSGGERCLTALSVLFAVYLVKPSPFCLLDEVDAPLDDPNTDRFVRMLRKFSASTQFLVVTHNKLTMEAANHLYGVTMMEPGVSAIVSVTFQDVAATQTDAELGDAIAARRRNLDQAASMRKILADDEEAPAGRFLMETNGEGEEAADAPAPEGGEPPDAAPDAPPAEGQQRRDADPGAPPPPDDLDPPRAREASS